MPFQVWIQTQRENVQKVKLILEETGQFCKTQKVKSGAQDGYMILPTNTYLDEEVHEESGYFQLLSDLGLCGTSQCPAAEIVYLSSPSPGPESIESKYGPIQEATVEWIQTIPKLSLWKTNTTRTDLLESSPKRWSIYEPMLLLPSGSFQSPSWASLLQSLDQSHLSTLWTMILRAVSLKEGSKELSHLAINSSIPLVQSSPSPSASTTETEKENILRTPSGLVLLYGDFGPVAKDDPTEQDLQEAFWASTKQNGIVQVWAPRYTMFSRGNIKEKARILSFHSSGTPRESNISSEELNTSTAVDLYAGIGYFAFSYAAMGCGQVWCWEINPWSVEGFRRGCVRNGWACKIIKGRELETSKGEAGEMDWVVRGGEKLVVFEESNERASERIERIREWEETTGKEVLGEVLHVNCGFLPSSRLSWGVAWRILSKSRSAWLHLHENVGVDDVETQRKEIEGIIGGWAREEGTSRIVEVEHVELVKTFAPGVWHCVFDAHVRPALADGR